ncbi:thioredoxin family protein [Candidatus Sumerlaeota bacterium]|nr:thioredoxin family protein [Candidatus Sumerlaeota bacterium]
MSEGKISRNVAVKILIVAALAVAVGVAIYAKSAANRAKPVSALAERPQAAPGGPAADAVAALPRLVDLGADKCIPCKMMAPILDELKTEYNGRFDVDVIDVWENPEPGQRYGIRVIPTQIFFDAQGKELFRHEGFFSKENILGKWKELGIEFAEAKEQ